MAVIFGDVPDVATFLQPGIALPLNLKVTLPGAFIFAVITIAWRYVAEVTLPAKVNELNAAAAGSEPGPAGGTAEPER